jgi:hypothetical protein
MKCLSLWQPWATLLAAGLKKVETRSWPIKHRGPLLIHAAKKWDSSLYDISIRDPFKSALDSLGVKPTDRGKMLAPTGLPLGAIVGRVEVVECYRTEDVDWDGMGLDVTPDDPVWQYAPGKLRLWPDPEKAFGDYSPGRFAFLCRDAVRFATPVPCRGMQGLFEVPDLILPMEVRP